MKTANDHAQDDYAALKATIEKLTADVSALSHSLTGVLKESAGRAAHEIGEKGKASQEAIEQTVRERPFQSLLAAFSVGLLIALLFRKH